MKTIATLFFCTAPFILFCQTSAKGVGDRSGPSAPQPPSLTVDPDKDTTGPVQVPSVELLTFTADPMGGNHVQLSWSTATETSNARFELDRSTDKEQWSTIAKVDGAGTSEVLMQYDHMDSDAPIGVLHYRLRQVDRDGVTTEYDPVTVLVKDELDEPRIFPNPGHGWIGVETKEVWSGVLSYALFDNCGHLIKSHQTNVGAGEVHYFDASDIPVGSYELLLTANGTTVSRSLDIVDATK